MPDPRPTSAQPVGHTPPSTRRRLVEAAADLIAERGYRGASVSGIAARAGLTTGAVYSAFGSKQALLVAVCTEAGDSWTSSQPDPGLGLRETLHVMAREAAGYAVDPAAQRTIRLQLEIFQLGMRDPGIFELLAAYARDQVTADAERLRRLAERDGVVLAMPAEHMAIVLQSALNGLSQVRLVNPDLAPDELFVRLVDRIAGFDPEVSTTDPASVPASAGADTTAQRAPRRTRRQA